MTRRLAERGREHATLFVVEARNARDDVGGGVAAEDGDAVVGALAAERGIPAEGLQVGRGKIGIGQLGLLQRDGIDRVGREPLGQVRQAYPQ